MDAQLLLWMYRHMALTQAFNGRFVEFKRDGRVPGPMHQTEGQEAVGIGGHSSTNPEVDFMDDEKVREFRAREPLAVLTRRILDEDVTDEATLGTIVAEVEEQAEAAVSFALESPWPDPAIATEGVFS